MTAPHNLASFVVAERQQLFTTVHANEANRLCFRPEVQVSCCCRVLCKLGRQNVERSDIMRLSNQRMFVTQELLSRLDQAEGCCFVHNFTVLGKSCFGSVDF